MTAMSIRKASVDTAPAAEFDIPVALVDVVADHRKHPAIAVQALAEDIAVNGLLQSIEVITKGDRYQLTFGRLRLEAAQHLGHATIRAKVRDQAEFVTDASLRLVSISENMNRNPLTALDRSVAIADWCAIYRAAQPSIKPGRKPAGAVRQELSLNLILNSSETDLLEASGQFAASFSEAAQAFLGISRAGVFRALKIASIPSLQRDRIALHPIAANQAELTALAQIGEPDRQVAVIDLILAGKVASVEDALAHLDNRTREVQPKWQVFSEKFGRMVETEQDRFFDLNVAAVDRWQSKRGRK